MAWWAAAAGIQGLTTLFGGLQQRSAAQEANRLREKIAKQQYKRQLKEYEIGWGQELTKYAWDTAKVEAERYIDRTKKAQYEQRMGWLTEAALKNLEINREALFDKYVIGEHLRAEQDAIALDDTMAGLSNQQQTTMTELQLQSGEVANQAKLAQLETSERVAGYVNAVQQRALQASGLVTGLENEAAKLQSELTLDAANDVLERDIQMVASIEESSRQRAILSARQGGSKSAVRAANNKMQALGRSYAKLSLNRQARGAMTSQFNSSVGTTANQMAQIGAQMKSAVDSIKYSSKSFAARQAGFGLAQLGLQNKAQGATAEFGRQGKTTLEKFNKLTLPSYGLAERQGRREMAGLLQQTTNTLREASMPYMDAIIFDPLKPIKGLKPEFYEPTKQYVPSHLSIALNTAGAAFKGAMSMSYRDASGNLAFM